MADSQSPPPATAEDESPPPLRLNEASTASPDHGVYEYMQQRRFISEQSALMEREIMDRMSVVRLHHAHYTSIASRFVGALEELAAETFDARDVALGRRAASKESAAAAAQRNSSQSTPRAGHRDPFAESTEGGFSTTPNRIVVTPKHATNSGIASTVTLSGQPQLHRKRVATRRLNSEAARYSATVDEFASAEQRRSEAHARREAAKIAKGQRAGKLTQSVEKAKLLADQEFASRAARDAINRKHDVLENRQKRNFTQKQAVTSAVRRLEDMTSQQLDEARARFEKTQAKSQARAINAHEKERAHMQATKQDSNRWLGNRRIRDANFRNVYEKEVQRLRDDIKLQENESVINQSKVSAAAQGVEVVWPEELSATKKQRKADQIDDLSYARLCGVRESVLRGVGETAGKAAAPRNPTVEEMESLRHLAPNHWHYLESGQPSPLWEAMRSVEACVIRGPQSVHWRK